MAIITTDDKHYSDIAQAIRDVTGSEKIFKPSDMAATINALKPAHGVEITMTQSALNAVQATEVLDSIKSENARVSLLTFNGSSSANRQVVIMGCVLFNDGAFRYFLSRKEGTVFMPIPIQANYDAVINVGDEYILYEVIM
jgi:hypothetical protein